MKKKKRILFIMPELLGGGAEKVLIDILKHFDYQTYTVTLLLEYRAGIYLSDVPQEVEIMSLHGKDNKWFQRFHRKLTEFGIYVLFHEFWYRRQILWKMRKRSFDTIISFMEGASVKLHSYIFHKAQNNISWVHIDFSKKHWTLNHFKDIQDERNIYMKMDCIVFVSEEARKGFWKVMDLGNTNTKVIYNLIDADKIRNMALESVPKDCFTICMVGRLNRQKRYDRAIEAFKLLKDNCHDFKVWILGIGELEQEIRNKVRDYKLSNVVEFKGFKKPGYHYVKSADLFLNTSESEGYPLTICEALCLGKPIVATDIAGSRELLGNSEYGVLTDETTENIYNTLKYMMNNISLCHEYSKLALQRSSIFNIDRTMNQIYQIL